MRAIYGVRTHNGRVGYGVVIEADKIQFRNGQNRIIVSYTGPVSISGWPGGPGYNGDGGRRIHFRNCLPTVSPHRYQSICIVDHCPYPDYADVKIFNTGTGWKLTGRGEKSGHAI